MKMETDPQSRSEHRQELMEEASSDERGFAEDPSGETAPQPTGEPDEGDDPQTAGPGDDAPSDAPQETQAADVVQPAGDQPDE